MRKLMMALAVAVAAAGLNAATVAWGATKGYLYDGATENRITSGSAYLMYVTSSYSQSDLVAAFLAADGSASDTLVAMTASGAMATTAGTIGSNARITGAESSSSLASVDESTAYFVVFNGDKMYVSVEGTSYYDSTSGEAFIAFDSISASSKLDFQASDGYSAAGWYAVPEPTSGLLLLLGMAGLALKRKRA